MAKITQRYKIKKLPKNIAAVDMTSAEVVPTDGNIFTIKNSGRVNLSYYNYIMLNLECLNAILSIGIKQVELGLLISICSNLLVNENICLQDNNEPHTTSSIAKLTGHSEQATKKKLNSLKKMDLLNHSFTKYKFGQKKVYRVNPHIIRKGVHMNSILATLFNDITVQSLMRKKQMSTKEVNPKK